MARQDRYSREKAELETHQRQVRRGQIAFAVLSVVLILSMVISLVRW